MRVGFLSLALIIVVFAGASGGLASATQIAFAQSPQPRNQTPPQDGLPSDQKKKLSGYDPADVFPITERETNPRAATRPPRKPTTAFPSTPQVRPPATSTAAPSVTSPATPLQSSPVETPSPTMAAGAIDSGGVQQPPLGQEDSSVKGIFRWTATGLLALALIVSALLIFTLTKLWEKIRESSSG